MRDDEFEKSYKYNIRHNYGQEGKRADYPPMRYDIQLSPPDANADCTPMTFSCTRIIGGAHPGPQDSHGCPFKHFSKDNLNTALLTTYGSCGVTPAILPEVQRLVNAKGEHYHVACTRVFEVTHGIKKGDGLGGGDSVGHPNRYFERSRELEREKTAPDVKIEVKTEVKAEDAMVE